MFLTSNRYGTSASLPTVGVINLLEAHEGLEQVVKTMDEDLVALLTELQESGALDDTMVNLFFCVEDCSFLSRQLTQLYKDRHTFMFESYTAVLTCKHLCF